MESGNGWIKLHRSLLENPITQKPKYLTLWITILLLANHKEKKFMWNGEIIIVHEGQFISGRKELSSKTGIPESTVEDILKYLEKQHQIQQQKTTKFRLITVLNWSSYQKSNNTSNNKATTKQQQTDTNKNDNNVIMKEEEVSVPSTIRKTKTHFLNARRKEKGLPPSIPRRSTKQIETTKALLDIDYFKAKGYEIHGMQFFKVESDDRNKVARKLFIKNREVLGDDIKPLIDWWFEGAGEFCDYSPEVAMSVKIVEKFQNSKRKPKSSDDEILKALKAIR